VSRIIIENTISKNKPSLQSRFQLIIIAAHRARNVSSGSSTKVKKNNLSSAVIALREFENKTIKIDNEFNALIGQYRTKIPLDDTEKELEEIITQEEQKKLEEQINQYN
jgi:DNA-directed RNA polymerase subunit omega